MRMQIFLICFATGCQAVLGFEDSKPRRRVHCRAGSTVGQRAQTGQGQ